MRCRTAFSSGPFLLISFCLCAAPMCAQRTPPPSPCISTAAASNAESDEESNHPKAIIDEVRFDAPIHLPQSVVDEAIAQVKGGMNGTDSQWLNEFLEVGIRGAWQDRGYFRVVVGEGKAEPLGGDSSEQHFRVVGHVDEGLQYHLGDIVFENGKAFSPGELRGLIPLEAGEGLRSGEDQEGYRGADKKVRRHRIY